MTIGPIETEYKGHLFRSRQEARWAVCLDELGIPWRYEYEGFELKNGHRYLPDFLLPERALWLEVKGTAPSADEIIKATLLAQYDRENGVLITWENFDRRTCGDNIFFWFDDNGVFHSRGGWRWLANPEPGWLAARAARFDGHRRYRWPNWELGEVSYGHLPY